MSLRCSQACRPDRFRRGLAIAQRTTQSLRSYTATVLGVPRELQPGIRHVYIKPRTPRLNSKVERSHRTDQQEFYQLLSYKGDIDLEQRLTSPVRGSGFFGPL